MGRVFITFLKQISKDKDFISQLNGHGANPKPKREL